MIPNTKPGQARRRNAVLSRLVGDRGIAETDHHMPVISEIDSARRGPSNFRFWHPKTNFSNIHMRPLETYQNIFDEMFEFRPIKLYLKEPNRYYRDNCFEINTQMDLCKAKWLTKLGGMKTAVKQNDNRFQMHELELMLNNFIYIYSYINLSANLTSK